MITTRMITHKYDADLLVAKLDPFTTGAYVWKCVNKKLFLCCKFVQNNQDVDLFMAMVFDEIGMGRIYTWWPLQANDFLGGH